jgi:hypothetical protein
VTPTSPKAEVDEIEKARASKAIGARKAANNLRPREVAADDGVIDG